MAKNDPHPRWEDEVTSAFLYLENDLVEEAAAILERLDREMLAYTGGADLPLRAAVVSHLARCHYERRDDAEAIRLTEEALRIDRLHNGRSGTFRAIASLALLRASSGDDDGFARDLAHLIELYRSEPGVDDRDDALRVISAELNRVAQRIDDRRRKRSITEGALRLRELLPPDANHAVIMNNLAVWLIMDGIDLPRAKGLIDRAFEIQRGLLPADDLQVAVTFHNLGHWHKTMGESEEARAAYRRALAISAGRDHPVVQSISVSLADLELKRGDDVAAKSAIDAGAGKAATEPDMEGSRLARTCDTYVRMGSYDAAEPIALQMVETARQSGAETREYAIALGRLAELRGLQRRPEARELFFESYRLLERVPGVTDDVLSTASNNVGRYLIDTEAHAEAIPFLERAIALGRSDDRLAWAAHANNLGIAYQGVGRTEEAISLLAEVLATRRALLPEGNRYIAQTLFNLGGTYVNAGRIDRAVPLLRESVRHEHIAIDQAFGVSTESERLAYMDEVLDSIGTTMALLLPYFEDRDVVALLFELAVQRKGLVAERIASERAAGSKPFSARLDHATAETIAAALPTGSVLIEFLAFELHYENLTRTGYNAFLLPAGRPDQISMVVVGMDQQLDEIVDTVYGMIEDELDAEDPQGWTIFGNDLRQYLFGRFSTGLGEARRLFLAPDGVLNRLPFHTLPDEHGEPLFETYQISYLASGRDLLRIGEPLAITPNPPVVVACPDYGAPGPFTPLRATRREGERVAEILGVKALTDAEATKKRVREYRSPRILHFATHGFYVPPPDGGRAGIDEVLFRSGLALSGANLDPQDGVLYAHDVLSMDLSGTALVVLSACETGLGRYHRGEGIYGLRRAFTAAGARTLLVSLWSVPDQATCELMELFYEELRRGASCATALREAQRTMRGAYRSALHWGAFIAIGVPAADRLQT
jgi:tetratricopeptide (TPR) repeat protein